MKVSYFETGHYRAPRPLPGGWPLPPAEYDNGAGADAYRGMVERLRLVEQLGFDWISVAEHHYSHRRVTPAPAIVAAHLAAHSMRIKIAVLGPIVSHINPVRIAEEMALLDNLLPGRLVVGLLRGTTGEYLSYGLNPTEARERTTEAMELILKAWTEPQPFGWQGRYFQFRGVAVWPRPATDPHPPTYVLGTSQESCEFAARHRLGLGLSYAPFPVIARAASYYREACEREGWQPGPEQVIYRANVLLAESDATAEATLQKMADQSPLPLPAAIGEELVRLDSPNIAGLRMRKNPAESSKALGPNRDTFLSAERVGKGPCAGRPGSAEFGNSFHSDGANVSGNWLMLQKATIQREGCSCGPYSPQPCGGIARARQAIGEIELQMIQARNEKSLSGWLVRDATARYTLTIQASSSTAHQPFIDFMLCPLL